MDETDTEIPNTKWGFFKAYVKKSPLVFWPLVAILSVIPARLLVDGPLENSMLSMVTVTAMGIQWIGIFRYRRTQKQEMRRFDMEHLESMMNLNKMGQRLGTSEFLIKFLTDFKMKRTRTLWHKLNKTRILSLYNMGENRSTSFTKIIVTEKEWFYLQLRNCIGTTDIELLQEGLAYLERDELKLRTTT